MTRTVSYACGVLLFCCAFCFIPPIAHTAALEKKEENAVAAILFRRDFPESNYASYVLEVRSDSAPVAVRAYFDLRQESRKLASIPLLPTDSKKVSGGHSTFLRVNCVAVDQVDNASFFYVYVSDPNTGKNIDKMQVRLRDAKFVARLPDKT